MAGFDAKYSEAERDALAHAYEDRGVKPAERVAQLARAGELEHNGSRLPAFDANAQSVRHYARVLRKRRAGQVRSELAAAPPRDAIEALRRRLVNACDHELAAIEKAQRRDEDVSGERLRQVIRAVRELAALPGPGDPRPAAPGQKRDGQRDGGETQGGLAGDIMKAHRASTSGRVNADETPAHNPPPPPSTHRDASTRENSAAHNTSAAESAPDDGTPGSPLRSLALRSPA